MPITTDVVSPHRFVSLSDNLRDLVQIDQRSQRGVLPCESHQKNQKEPTKK